MTLRHHRLAVPAVLLAAATVAVGACSDDDTDDGPTVIETPTAADTGTGGAQLGTNATTGDQTGTPGATESTVDTGSGTATDTGVANSMPGASG